jgi:hypothetical protein
VAFILQDGIFSFGLFTSNSIQSLGHSGSFLPRSLHDLCRH